MRSNGRVRLYIDVDGVILKPFMADGRLAQTQAEDVAAFLDWATGTFECWWLTAWAIGGDSRKLRRGLLPHLPPCARRIRTARWTRLKTDALRDGRFLWIDDELYAGERELLKKRRWLARFVRVDPFERSLLPVRRKLEAKARRLFR